MCKKYEHLQPPFEYLDFTDIDTEDADAKHKEYIDTDSAFNDDIDNILRLNAFQRLSLKTQVYTVGVYENCRNRFSHTIEVARLSRVFAERLGLNAELAEAIALAHDIGHAPFGHIGETVLNMYSNFCIEHKFLDGVRGKLSATDLRRLVDKNRDLLQNLRGFSHNHNSVRILCETKMAYFTNFTLFGALYHTGVASKECNFKISGRANQCKSLTSNMAECPAGHNWELSYFDRYKQFYCIKGSDEKLAWSFEAMLVYWADEITQRVHGMVDALKEKLAKPSESIEIFAELVDFCKSNPNIDPDVKKSIDQKKWKKANKLSKGNCWHDFRVCFSEFVIELYRELFLAAFDFLLDTFSKQYTPNKTEKEFFDAHALFSEKEYLDLCERLLFYGIGDFSELARIDRSLCKELSSVLLDLDIVKGMDGKGAFVLRKILEAYMTNPQQMPDAWIPESIRRIERTVKLDLDTEEKVDLVSSIKDDTTQSHKHRRLMTELMDSDDYGKFIKRIIFRIIIDRVADMGETNVMTEYNKLYG